jgi:peptidoglycan/xylan/chitin deacetylase (PgdA/CDA1 family)
MKIILRDDDLNYFSKIERIKEIYEGIWDKHLIHFAAIPMIFTRQKDVPLIIKAEKDYYEISHNKKLIDFLKEKIKENKIAIWQHGFSHRIFGNKYELERNDEKKLFEELKRGKEILESAFEIKINTLVAPHDRFSKSAILAAEKIGYERICRDYSPLPREFIPRKEYVNNFSSLLSFWLKHGIQYRYPRELDFGGHKELYFYRIEDFSETNYRKIIKFVQDNQGMLCITSHHLRMGDRILEMLKKIISESNENTML